MRQKVKRTKRPKLRRGKLRAITRAQARRLAARHVSGRMFKHAIVRDGAEANLRIYARAKFKPEDVLVVYKNAPEWELKSSEVVVVSKRTGQIFYEGSTGDEG